jgi:glycosyltransferase involved in cell wall biosynthesis
MLYDGPENRQHFSHGAAKFITPSHWSKAGFLRHGFRAEDVAVVPHGVAPEVYRPMAPADRAAARKGFGLADESFVFLSVGAMTWNKGIDKLLTRAICTVSTRGTWWRARATNIRPNFRSRCCPALRYCRTT